MGTYAKYTCYHCQIRRPSYYMKQIEVRRKTGSSGWGVSFNPQRKKSVRVSAPRNYHSVSKKWVCDHENACDNPNYYVEREAKLAAERAEREARLAAKRAERERQKAIADQKKETCNLIEKEIDDFLNSSKIARRFSILKPLTTDTEIQTAFTKFRERFAEHLRIETSEKLISKIIRQGDLRTRTPLSKPSDIIFEIPSKSPRKNIVRDVFLGVEKEPKRGFLKTLWFWILMYLKFVLFICTLGVSWLLMLIFRRKKPAEIYEKEIKKIAKLVSRRFEITPLLDEVISHLKSDDKLKSLPYFKECYPKVVKGDLWKSIKVQKTNASSDKPKSKSETKEKQTLRQVYESDEFFDVCMIVLMRAVGGADGDLSQDEMNTIRSKYTVSVSSEKLISQLLKIKGHKDLIIELMNKLFAGNTFVLELVINNLMTLAEADGEVSKSELQEVHSIGKKLGLTRKAVQNIIENKHPLDEEDERVRLFDEEFFPEFEEIMT